MFSAASSSRNQNSPLIRLFLSLALLRSSDGRSDGCLGLFASMCPATSEVISTQMKASKKLTNMRSSYR
ncbi:hypothetical protein L596_011729 [Steinernema carpocapsae]|uniref:Secreted protein n=1 Tax=Steinernema carpocapsae TaxID=34508 RepID=A0A4U5NV96_STECR|nr:hypothetical protein L596_011729 [Steinernema carpocapsae]